MVALSFGIRGKKVATINCPCGHAFLDGEIPSPYAWTLISDVNRERALDEILNKAKAGQDIEAQAEVILASYGLTVYLCPNCKRLLVFKNGIDNFSDSYLRE